jgi:hypothetical protein
MRYYITFFVLYITASTGYSQEAPDYTSKINEINIGFNKEPLGGTYTFVGFKHSFSNGALRAGTGLKISMTEDESEWTNSSTHRFVISPKIGYEFQKWFNRFGIYYGADLVYTYGKYKSEINDVDQEGVSESISRDQRIALRPLLGLSVFIFESLSISMESFIDLSYLTSGEKSPESEDPWTNTLKGVSANLVPIGLITVNYHF